MVEFGYTTTPPSMSLYDIAGCCDFLKLSDSIDAIKRLVLEHRVPLRLHQEDMICYCQVEATDMVSRYALEAFELLNLHTHLHRNEGISRGL